MGWDNGGSARWRGHNSRCVWVEVHVEVRVTLAVMIEDNGEVQRESERESI